MKIASAKFFSTRELISRLKKVTMLQDKHTFPYVNAEIAVTDINTSQLHPAQRYVLRSEFDKVRDLRWAFIGQYNVDILRLADSRTYDGRIVDMNVGRDEPVGFVEFTIDENPEIITILPPIVETGAEADKSVVNIINDGMHRAFLSRVSSIVPAVVKVSRLPKELPYYAYPLPDGWAGVSMVDKIDPSLLKKYHRFPSNLYKNYYRDFNSAFTNVGGPRGVHT